MAETLDPIEQKLHEMGLEVPELATPVANYLPYKRTGNILYLGGVVSYVPGGVSHTGKVPEDVSVEEAYAAAKICGLNHLAVIKQAVGRLDRVKEVIKIVGYVASSPDFVDQPKVINGISDLFIALYGDRGRHTRLALGISEIGLHAPVETEMIVEVYDD